MSQAGKVVYAHKTRSSEGFVAFASEKVNYLVIFDQTRLIWGLHDFFDRTRLM